MINLKELGQEYKKLIKLLNQMWNKRLKLKNPLLKKLLSLKKQINQKHANKNLPENLENQLNQRMMNLNPIGLAKATPIK